ncbi:toprim domain-containing protein [Capnocytophaga felis]|uniref:Topoisomerase n=1 Tax=Capnocytophaga felis TaxID=2267611 RepID=A0A5M4BC33_9FLAO|nr:toprim domain-containing protein [Capnocytophaga felis]GET47128.1 topoisomerase [Capnocytophaga felis]GET49575.1 topoisomerase [Capnocytophaga felis]
MLKKQDILNSTDGGLEVFRYYLQGNWQVGKNFKNPLYDDKNASCNIYKDKRSDTYKMKDFGDESFSGDCFFLVGYLHGLDCRNASNFIEILKIINRDMSLGLEEKTRVLKASSKRNVSSVEPIENTEKTNEIENGKNNENNEDISDTERAQTPYEFISKAFTEQELAFWSKSGITHSLLQKYEVVAMQRFSSINKKGKPYTLHSSQSEPMFGYVSPNSIKVYRPFSKIRFLYGGNVTDYCFGLEKLPLQGDVLFITSGEKDVLSLVSHGFSAICFNSETTHIRKETIKILKPRFRYIVLLFDADETGRKASQQQQERLKEFGVLSLTLPLSGSKKDKDISDYFQQGFSAQDFRQLFRQLIENDFQSTLSLLKSCEIDWKNPPPKQEVLISINAIPIGVQSSLLGITGGEGTGKSHFVSALLAGTLTLSKITKIDTLGTQVKPCPKGKVVLFFDTEQSQDQLYQNIEKLLKRAQHTVMPPELKAYCLTQIPRKERWELIRKSLEFFSFQYKGIHLVVIDGIADLIGAVNNEIESTEIIEELYALAGMYQTCMVCVLHLTPSGLKIRGHLGSELQRKASAVLSIEKDNNGTISVVRPLKVRSGDLSKTPEILFQWDETLGMHRYCGERKKSIENKDKTMALATLISPLFKKKTSWHFSDLCKEIQEITGVTQRTAKIYIRNLKEKEILIHTAENPEVLEMGKPLKTLLET